MIRELARDWRKMSKPRDVEEVTDTYLIRPLGFVIVQLLRHTPVTPTMVSILSAAAGGLTAWLYFLEARSPAVTWVALWAGLALLLHSALDAADGQLARLTGRHTPLGRLVDGLCDNVSFFAIYAGIWIGTAQRMGDHLWLLFVIALAAGYAHSIQSALVEYERLLYQDFVERRLDVSDELDEEILEAEVRRVTGPLAPLFAAWTSAYHEQQRRLLPTSARIHDLVTRYRRQDPGRVAGIGEVWSRHQRPLLRWWAVLATNSHKYGIVAASLLPVTGAGFWGDLGMAWFFFYDLALLPVMVGVMFAQRRADRRVAAELGLEANRAG